MIFLLLKFVSFLDFLPKTSDLDSESYFMGIFLAEQSLLHSGCKPRSIYSEVEKRDQSMPCFSHTQS